jgi:hypothetical protein
MKNAHAVRLSGITGYRPEAVVDDNRCPCFAPGTAVLTDRGEIAVEDLVPGMAVVTADHGLRDLLWIGERTVDFRKEPDRLRPVRISAGAFGKRADGTPLPGRDLVVSPQHRMVIDGLQVAQLRGDPQALAPAAGLAGLPGVEILRGTREVTYFALLLDRHEIIYAEGAATESFRPGPIALADFTAADRAAVHKLYPGLADNPFRRLGAPARPILTVRETQAVLQAADEGRPAVPLAQRLPPESHAAAPFDEDL